MAASDIVIEINGQPTSNSAGGWLDTIVDFEFPSSVAVLTFDLSWTGDSQTGTNVPYSDSPTVSVSGQGGTLQTSVLDGGTQMLKNAVGISAFSPFSKEDKTSFPLPDYWNYTKATVIYGLRGGAYPRGGGTFSGADSAEVFSNAFAAISSGLMVEFGWDYPTTVGHMVGVSFLYPFLILEGAAPASPPIVDPKIYDTNAITNLVPGGTNHVIQDWHNMALVIPISPFKGPGTTVAISMKIAGPPTGNTYTWIAGCATYKKAQKGWEKNPPSGWNIGKETYPTYASYPWHRTQGYDHQLLGSPGSAVDSQEIDSHNGVGDGPAPGPRSIKFTIDAKTLKITPSG